MKDLASRLVWPAAHASDAHAYMVGAYRPIVQLSTDGFAAYPENRFRHARGLLQLLLASTVARQERPAPPDGCRHGGVGGPWTFDELFAAVLGP
jgi:hypothetical protein